jgi:lipopolysaccharide/colanic/teichoic acid biosynthesis glycosyltransferase
MISDSSKIGLRNITVRDDPRVTTFGKFLRSSKINELPQLFNVLFGEMSIVGPRPLPPKSFIKYSKEGQLVVSKSKPGITGISSVIFRDEEAFATLWQNNNLDVEFMYKTELYPYKEELEQWFFSHKSLKTYFLLIFLTCYAVFFNPRKILNSIFKDLPKSNLFNP